MNKIPIFVVLIVLKPSLRSVSLKLSTDASFQFPQGKSLPAAPCDVQGTGLVEQFFNVIFTEFHHSPPACMCVQMCPDQPTYCYPNGCFKRTETKKETVSKIQHDGEKLLFLIDSDKGFFEESIGNTNSVTPHVTDTKTINSNLIGHPGPFKDVVFKYKRIPKLEIRYNLREQVKHTKEKKAQVDVSQSRWPTYKQLNRHLRKIDNLSSNHYTTSYPESNQQETRKVLKRYLTKRENSLDISALHLYKDATNFSLETLIDNLIERGLDDVNTTLGLKISKSSELKDEALEGDLMILDNVKGNILINQNDTNYDKVLKNVSETTRNKEQYKYDVNVANSTTTYFEMITTLSKEIEKQNNVSIVLIENLTSKNLADSANNKTTTIFNFQPVYNITSNIAEREDVINAKGIKSTTNNLKSVKADVPVTGQVKKGRQRVLKKLRNRKFSKYISNM